MHARCVPARDVSLQVLIVARLWDSCGVLLFTGNTLASARLNATADVTSLD